MRALIYGLAGAALAAAVASAQTATTAPRSGTVAAPPPPPAHTVPDTTDNTNNGKAAASGNNNQALATTSESADQPAKGANSFTETEARHRMEAKGYTNISALSKNDDGVWVGDAEKNGQSTTVWLDYKGNVGERM